MWNQVLSVTANCFVLPCYRFLTDTTKRRQPKRRHIQNGDKSKTATRQNGDTPKRRHVKTATNPTWFLSKTLCLLVFKTATRTVSKRRHAPFWLSPSWLSPLWMCRRFGVSPFWMCRRFGCCRFGVSPFWLVAVLVCRRFGVSPFWFVAVLVVAVLECRRFGLSPFWLSPFWSVAVLVVAVLVCRHFDVSPFWICRRFSCRRFGFVAVFTYIPGSNRSRSRRRAPSKTPAVSLRHGRFTAMLGIFITKCWFYNLSI